MSTYDFLWRNNIIIEGFKHIFLCINIYWAPREVLNNPSLKGEGFKISQGAKEMLMHQKSMFDRYCIK